jgi:LysR family transcriptional regulator, low CO2-responsive transcriptional regulator
MAHDGLDVLVAGHHPRLAEPQHGSVVAQSAVDRLAVAGQEGRVGQVRGGRCPAARITVHIGEPIAAIRAAESGAADFAVSTLQDVGDSETLVVRRLWEEPIVLGVGPHGPPVGDSVALAEIAELPMVAAPQEVAYDRLLSAQLHRYGVAALNVVIRLGHAEAIKQVAIDNG